MFMTRSLSFRPTPKKTEQHLIVRSDKSVAYVTNNKRLLDVLYCIAITTDRHEASRGLFATADLLVYRGPVANSDLASIMAQLHGTEMLNNYYQLKRCSLQKKIFRMA